MTGWWYTYPLKNTSQLGLLSPVYGKIENVRNHQPDDIHHRICMNMSGSQKQHETATWSYTGATSPIPVRDKPLRLAKGCQWYRNILCYIYIYIYIYYTKITNHEDTLD